MLRHDHSYHLLGLHSATLLILLIVMLLLRNRHPIHSTSLLVPPTLPGTNSRACMQLPIALSCKLHYLLLQAPTNGRRPWLRVKTGWPTKRHTLLVPWHS